MNGFGVLLVANRGEIARRVFRTGRAMGMRCVAVYVDADADAPFVADADEAIRLPAGGYLDGDVLLEAARRTGAEVIHPGYGFLSENAAFARQVEEAGIAWAGPTPEVIEAMGDKLAAKRIAVEAGVPTLPSVDDPAGAADVGYPLLVKAAAGGGGKGMRIVESADALEDGVASARREAKSGFGDDRVFLERYVARARHIEVQLLGDDHGNLVHFGERECSIQRRHQKIIEEAPSPGIGDEARASILESALTLGRALGYRSAGTVEFLYDDERDEHYFLEVNTRLQVEHPVTEEVTGIDLVREQLRVAAGHPLGVAQADVQVTGHAIEARLYAEDPDAGFLPATGTLAAYDLPEDREIRWENGVDRGSVVGVDFDPMLAKVIAWAPTRGEAARRLARGLEGLHLGGVVTNRDFLVSVLEEPSFLDAQTTTDYLERVQFTDRVVPVHDVVFAAGALALWLQGAERARSVVQTSLPSGWRNARLPRQERRFRCGDDEHVVRYEARRDDSFDLDDGSARLHAWDDAGIDVEIDGRRLRCAITTTDERAWVQVPTGTVEFELLPRFSPPETDEVGGGLVAPMPGSVLEVRTSVGAAVTAGDVLVVLEAMKMEHHVRAPLDGTVSELRVAVGDQVANGALLLVIDEAGEPEAER